MSPLKATTTTLHLLSVVCSDVVAPLETSSSGANSSSEDTAQIKKPIPITITIVTKTPKANQVFFMILKIFSTLSQIITSYSGCKIIGLYSEFFNFINDQLISL